jgi:hypothetical protein
MSNRKFVSFKAKQAKNFIYFLIADSMGNIHKFNRMGERITYLSLGQGSRGYEVRNLFMTHPLHSVAGKNEVMFFSGSL